MPILDIVQYPSPVLKKKASPVDKVTPELVQLMDDMAETLYAVEGRIGLAAPQVGVSKRIIIIDIRDEKIGLIQIANPEIIESEGKIEWNEGCLSVPGLEVKMKRKNKVVVQGLDKHNRKVEFHAEGLLAVVFQHEIDHLEGKLIIDNASSLKREMYLKEMRKKESM